MPWDTFRYDKVEVFIFVSAYWFLYTDVEVIAAPGLLSFQYWQSTWHIG